MTAVRMVHMTFADTSNGKRTISVPNAKADLDAAAVKAAMNTILAKNVFETKGGALAAIVSAKVVESQTTELDVTV